MPNESPEKTVERTMAGILSLVGVVIAIMCLSGDIPNGGILGTLYCIYLLLSVSGFVLFLHTRRNQQSFWLLTAAVTCLVAGLALVFIMGLNDTGSFVYDIIGGFLRNCMLGVPFATAITQILGGIYYHTNS